VKIYTTYRFIASVLSLSIMIGVSVPAGLHAMSGDLCDEMQEMHHPAQPMSDHGEDCPMSAEMPAHDQNEKKHHKLHDLGFACACSLDEAPVKTEAKAQLKVKVPALQVTKLIVENHIDDSETRALQIQVSDSYSPPPIYLTNESFLI